MNERAPDLVEVRCADGVGCAEVIERLHAADVARAIGEVEQARRLQAAAGRWAEAHAHGGAAQLGEESVAS